MKISTEEAKTILLRAGLDIRSIEVPEAGVTRAIFFCDVGGQLVYVTLLSPQDREVLYFLHNKIGLQSLVPLAEIVASGHDQQSNHSYVVQTSLAGQNLQAFRNLQEPMSDAGRQLKKIHSVELPGFGKIYQDKTGEFRGKKKSWADFLSAVVSAKKINYLVDQAVLNDEQGKIIAEISDELSDTAPKCGVLLHRDYDGGNVCSDGNRVTGVIDWEQAAVGVAEYDLAISEYFFGAYFPKLLVGYGSDVNLGWVDRYGLMFAVHKVFLALDKHPTRYQRAKNALDNTLARILQ